MCAKTTDSADGSDPGRSLASTDVAYDPDTDTYHTNFGTDDCGDAVVVAVVDAVAVATDREVTTMPPLFASLDPNALTALVTSGREDPITVTFTYEGCRLTVASDGTVIADPMDDG